MMNSRILELPKSVNISFNIFKNKKLLIFISNNIKNYIIIPNDINFEKKDRTLIFISNKRRLSELDIFLKSLNDIITLTTVQKFIRKKLILKGLGYKMSFLNNDHRILEMKLGFSHVTTLSIPYDLKVTLEKLKITVEGLNGANVGNFISKLKSLKTPDLYKGKGFWYPNEAVILKEVKKK